MITPMRPHPEFAMNIHEYQAKAVLKEFDFRVLVCPAKGQVDAVLGCTSRVLVIHTEAKGEGHGNGGLEDEFATFVIQVGRLGTTFKHLGLGYGYLADGKGIGKHDVTGHF